MEKRDVQELRRIYKEDLEKLNKLQAEAEVLKVEMDNAEKAYDAKLKQLRKDGYLSSESYIATGNEDENFFQEMADLEEYQEEIYAGKEKEAYREARGNYNEKLMQIINFQSEVSIAKYALEQAEENSEPGDNA